MRPGGDATGFITFEYSLAAKIDAQRGLAARPGHSSGLPDGDQRGAVAGEAGAFQGWVVEAMSAAENRLITRRTTKFELFINRKTARSRSDQARTIACVWAGDWMAQRD